MRRRRRVVRRRRRGQVCGFDTARPIDYTNFVTETKFVPRLSTRTRTRTRTIQAWPALAGSEQAWAPTSTPSSPLPLDTAELPHCGETIGGHCVLRVLLGEGAFGRVFAAEDEQTGQQVALKVVGLRRYPREYAEHELRALASIAHPNVVQLNEHGVETSAREPYLWYTMPLYKGSDLAALLESEGSLPLRRAHAVFSRIAGGVCEMHALGLRHQDIKPDNVYLATMAGVADHHPVLLDLGGAARENASRPLVATFPFAAPEQTEALIGGWLGEEHPALTEQVDVYGLAATLLFSLIGPEFTGHDIGQNDSTGDVSRPALVDLRARLQVIHATRARKPVPDLALPYLTGAARERLNGAFRRWLSLDPESRPSARGFVEELSVLLEWDAEVLRERALRELRRKLFGVAGGLSLAAGVGGLVGYQWHKRTMVEANRATHAAIVKADEASSELEQAGTNLDKIIADPSLGAVEKARKIAEIVTSLEAQTARLVAVNAELRRGHAAAESQARLRAQQEKAAFEGALAKMQVERDTALQEKSLAQTAVWKAEAERDQARTEQAAEGKARANAERELTKSQQDKAVAENARLRAEEERAKLEREKSTADAAQRTAEAERDQAQQSKATEVAAAFAKGVEAGSRARPAPAAIP